MESLHSLLFTFASMGMPLLMPLVFVVYWHERIERKVLFVCVGAILGFLVSDMVQALPIVNILSTMLGFASREPSVFGHSTRFWFSNICYLALAIVVPYVLLRFLSQVRGIGTSKAIASGGTARHNRSS